MARAIRSRLRIKGRFTARTPLHVGGYGESVETDLPLARNGAGAWYIPGTSITGVLRAWCLSAFGEEATDVLWGPPMTRGNPDRGHASFVLIEDAEVTLPVGAAVEIRDGVGIDRVWGTAAERIKFDRAILPRGSTFDLEMTVALPAKSSQHAPDPAQAEAMIGHLLEALQRGEIAFGAARTRGLGEVTFALGEVKREALDSRDGILDLLAGAGKKIGIEDLKGADATTTPKERSRLEIEIAWAPRTPVMVKAGYEGMGIDILPLVSAVSGGVSFVLPGSSLKGAFRSQAERIVRTLRSLPAPRHGSQLFMDQLAVPLVEELFGAPAEHARKGQGAVGRCGALRISDCYAAKAIDRKGWETIERERFDEEQSYEVQDLGKCIAKHPVDLRHHVAIDRWTGGAAEGALYSVLVPYDPEEPSWEPIRIVLDLGRLPKDLWHPAMMLLFLVLREFASQALPIGFGVNRGLGEVEVRRISFRVDAPGDDLVKGLDGCSLEGGRFDRLDARLRETLAKAWQAWIDGESTRLPEEREEDSDG